MHKSAIAIIALLLAGCNKEPESVQQVGSSFEVGRLFTTDGCTVYRFSDGGRNVYFTNCTGSTSSSYQTSNGKYTTTHDTEVMTSSAGGGKCLIHR